MSNCPGVGEECFESNVPEDMPAGAGKNATRITVTQTQTRRATKSQVGKGEKGVGMKGLMGILGAGIFSLGVSQPT